MMTVIPERPITLVADPNPVPAGTGLGGTAVIWNTGHPDLSGRVYVAVDGGDERLFAESPSGRLIASPAAYWCLASTSPDLAMPKN